MHYDEKKYIFLKQGEKQRQDESTDTGKLKSTEAERVSKTDRIPAFTQSDCWGPGPGGPFSNQKIPGKSTFL